MMAPISQPTAEPVASAATTPSAIARGPASTPPKPCRTAAIARPDRLAVKVIARLKPPEMIGISIASVSRPSSGNWKAIDVKVVALRKLPAVAPKITQTISSRASRPMISGSAKRARARPSSRERVLDRHCAVLCRMGAPRQEPISLPTPSLDKVIATRMMTPTIILKA